MHVFEVINEVRIKLPFLLIHCCWHPPCQSVLEKKRKNEREMIKDVGD